MGPTLLMLLGLVATLVGLGFANGTAPRKHLFLGGCLMLLTASTIERNEYFICLQAVVLLGCLLAYLPGYDRAKRIGMFVIGAAVVAWVARHGSIMDLLGGIGLLVVAAGFATNAPLYYGLGSLLVGLRSAIEFYQSPSLLPAVFAVLNLVFLAVCIVQARRPSPPPPPAG